VIIKTIESEVNKSVCFSWQVDETTDISCLSQLSVIFRYAIDGKVIERFMGFFNVSEGRKADDLFNLLTTTFNRFNLPQKLVGQTYDGVSVASVMAREQSKIRSVSPQAKFTHCYAHRLNLILQDASGKIKECRIFFW
jgi:hypothetical protein